LAKGGEEKKAEESNVLDFDKLWDYGKPGETRVLFEEHLAKADKAVDLSYYLQLQTQIARTLGLQQMFDSAHVILDEVESQLSDDLPLVKVRCLLERGRTLNSSGKKKESEPLFIESYELATKIGADFYAIDAAHMVAIVAESREDRMKWSLLGIDIAEKTSDKRARGWLGSITNNVGWDYHDAGEYEDALKMFEKALAFREESGKQKSINIAKWCVARAYRSLERYDEALEIQLALESFHKEAGDSDGYVWEELGELYHVKKDDKATAYFAMAYEALSKINWLVESQPERIERLKKLGKVEE